MQKNTTYYIGIKIISKTYGYTFALSNYHEDFKLGNTTYVSNKIIKITEIESSTSLHNSSTTYEFIFNQPERELLIKDSNLLVEISYLKFINHKFDKKIIIKQGKINNITIINHIAIIEINSLIFLLKNHINNLYYQ